MDRTGMACALAELASLALSLVRWEAMIASAAIALAYGFLRRSRHARGYNELLAFARELDRELSGKCLSAALREASRSPSCPKELRDISRRSMLGDFEQNARHASADPETRELAELVSMGVSRGADIRKGLKAFIQRLEADIESRNAVTQNSLNMNSISSIGVFLFVPVFGGIGASIIGASGAIAGPLAAGTAFPFEAVVVFYLAVMGYVMQLFRKDREISPAIGSIQAAIIGAAIIRSVSTVVAYAI